MRFLKRFISIIILLLLVFFVYRIINPSAAKALLYDIKYFFNERVGTNFVLDENTEEFLSETGTILDETGAVLDIDTAFQEIDDEILFDDNIDESFGSESSDLPQDGEKTTPSSPVPVPSPAPASPSSSNNGLSNQDLKDLQNMLENFQ